MQSHEIRRQFLDFFAKRGHAVLLSASLVPQNDPTVLFTTAGMQPLVPYLMGAPHPAGDKLVNVQKCVRTTDIDDIGDNTHATFFEMLGNWSLGSYFKEEAIKWSYEFLTSKEEGLGLDPARLYVTVFAGDENVPKDTESFEIWKKVGVPEHRIYFKGADTNWWPAVKDRAKDTWTGPTGPCSEMFYDVTEEGLGDLTLAQYIEADEKVKVVEIWNDVFMEYEKVAGKIVGKLKQKNVDTGAGLERLSMMMQNVPSIFDTDLFLPIMKKVEEVAVGADVRQKRIIADHIRTSVFMILDGVTPSNTDRGYILRRLIRRVTRPNESQAGVAEVVIENYQKQYPELLEKKDYILSEIKKEEDKFKETLQLGLSKFEKGEDPFILHTTYGFPIDLTKDLAAKKGVVVDLEDFEQKFKQHQSLSRAGSEQKFKGGLANTNEQTVRLHTAHHLLLAALQRVLGAEVHQRGSNITEERLRIDFAFERKVTKEELQKAEDLVNEWISQALPVERREMPRAEAEKLGAEMEFGAKYPDTVSVYVIKNPAASADEAGASEYISKEFCGGPHVANTSELGHFKIAKEEAVSAGVRRIKAVLE